jgi:protein-tyrosine phosphatase
MTEKSGQSRTSHDVSSVSKPDVRNVRSILFVCLGNICRSPLAQGVLEHLANARGVRDQLNIESRGTGGWHVGDPPDPRTIASAQRNGVALTSRAKQLSRADFDRFDLLLAMDDRNRSDILSLGCPAEKIVLFLAFAPEALGATVRWQVPDPYTGTTADFDRVYTLVHAGAEGLLDAIFPNS